MYFLLDLIKTLVINQKLDLKKVYEKFDNKGIGKLDIDRLGSILRIIDKKLTDDEISFIFLKLDVDNKGFLSYKDFLSVISSI